jgi:hypothetical protein
VQSIKTRLPSFGDDFRRDDKFVLLDGYFARPNEEVFQSLTYTAFFKRFVIVRKKPTSTERFFRQLLMPLSKPVYIVERAEPEKSIVRMEMLFPTSGDIFYLRIILLNRPVINFKDAFTWNGTVYKTFQQSAVAAGYIQEK